MKYRPKHIVEYAALRGFQILVNLIPYRVALAGGAGISWIAFNLVGWRVKAAKKRIREVLGDDLPAREVRRIAALSMRYMFFNAVDVLRAPRWTKEKFAKRSNFHEASDAMNQLIADGRGAICALPHMGSWELGGVAATTHNIPMFFIYGEQRNPLFNKLMTSLRTGSGTEAISREDKTLLRKVVRNLKAGKILAMVNDLRSKTEGLPIQFLGKEANIVAGMALFARQAKVPILPMVAHRESWTQHRCVVFDPIEPDLTLDKRDDWIRMTQLTMSIYEKEIRKHPEQYFWYNKRWVLDPFISEVAEPSTDQPMPKEQSAP
jgi:KDO2-lipid IV(A) lauroyltransferase